MMNTKDVIAEILTCPMPLRVVRKAIFTDGEKFVCVKVVPSQVWRQFMMNVDSGEMRVSAHDDGDKIIKLVWGSQQRQ